MARYDFREPRHLAKATAGDVSPCVRPSGLNSCFMCLLFSSMIKIFRGSQRLLSPSHLFLLQQAVASPSPEEGTSAPIRGGRCCSSISRGGGFNTLLRDGSEHIPDSAVCSDTGVSLLGVWSFQSLHSSPSGSACSVLQSECCRAGWNTNVSVERQLEQS